MIGTPTGPLTLYRILAGLPPGGAVCQQIGDSGIFVQRLSDGMAWRILIGPLATQAIELLIPCDDIGDVIDSLVLLDRGAASRLPPGFPVAATWLSDGRRWCPVPPGDARSGQGAPA